jgi:hypothetical protein
MGTARDSIQALIGKLQKMLELGADGGIGAFLELKGGTFVSLEDITDVMVEMPEYAVREGKPVRVR